MRIAEIRAAVRGYSKEQLELLVVELYRAMPKSLRDSRSIDAIVQNPDAQEVRRIKSSSQPSLDFDDVAYEARTFIDYAKRQYYFAPNSYVLKKDRPKWRFIAKRLYRSLVQCAAEAENLEPATNLIEELYLVLCEGCRTVLFSSEDPFGSVGISQGEFFRQLLTLRNRYMDKDTFVQKAVALVIDGMTSRWSSRTDLVLTVLDFLTIPDLKFRAIKSAQELGAKQLSEYSKARRSDKQYHFQRTINALAELALHCYAQLGELEEGIKYFSGHYVDNDEMKLYVMVTILHDHYNQTDLLLDQIVRAMANGVRPRSSLIKLANSIRAAKK
ncbi:MAG: hypothetical protein VB144_12340 [Clostridia bacterium]|nr:hypothetical protein [Clostridia bacterium]